METSKKSQRKHANFQDRYRRSSNFRSVIKRESFSLKGDGEVSLENNDK